MSIIPQTYTCDADGCTKKYDKDTNGWIAMNVVDVTIPKNSILTVSRFNGQREKVEGCKHVCGSNCASILFANWMNEQL